MVLIAFYKHTKGYFPGVATIGDKTVYGVRNLQKSAPPRTREVGVGHFLKSENFLSQRH